MLGTLLGSLVGTLVGTLVQLAQALWYTLVKAEGINPSLILDFANNRYAANNAQYPVSSVLTVARATTGTYFDSSGLLQSAAANNDFAASVNGAEVVTATGTLVNGTGLEIGNRAGFSDRTLCGHIKELRYYPIRVSNTELQRITT